MNNDFPEYWAECTFEQLLDYIQPGPYIVESTDYSDKYQTPVLTAGKSFIKGYTNEKTGIFDSLPTIIFDDFTTATQFVNFPFKVKSSAMKILVPAASEINIKFLYYLMQVTHVNADSHKRYWIGIYSKEKIAIPSYAEQKRIVAKIEELFSELDNGIAALKTAREQLKVYRQAVLKHAFEGRLTAKWREENANKLESPEQFIARIQEERKDIYRVQLAEWNVAVAEWESQGKEGKAPPRPKQPKNSASRVNKCNNLPESWALVPLEELISFGPSNGWSPKATNDVTSTKAITLTATTSGKFDGTQFKYIDARIPKHSSLWLKKNDILVQRGNTIEYVGVPSLYCGDDNQFIYPDLIMKIQTSKSVSPQYITHAMSMVSSRSFLRERAVGAAGSMPKINQQTVSSLPIPICSELEQQKIITLLEEKLSIIDSTLHEIHFQLERSAVLRQSILKKAFSGQLVPQDPNDEPASELLARIQAEKVAEKAAQKASVKPKAAAKSGAKRGRKPKVAS